MSRVLVAVGAVLVALLSPSLALEARAQDHAAAQPTPLLASAFGNTRLESLFDASLAASQPVPDQRTVLRKASIESHGSTLLASLYASTAMWQALDVHSTFRVLDRGGYEGNPLLAGITENRPAFIATKAAIAAGSIYAASRIGRHNKVAAAAALIGINAAYAVVVSHNYALARGLR